MTNEKTKVENKKQFNDIQDTQYWIGLRKFTPQNPHQKKKYFTSNVRTPAEGTKYICMERCPRSLFTKKKTFEKFTPKTIKPTNIYI